MRKRLSKKLNPPLPKRTPLEEAMHGMLCKLDDDLTADLFATAHPLALNSNHPTIRPLSSDSVFYGWDFGFSKRPVMQSFVRFDSMWQPFCGVIKGAL